MDQEPVRRADSIGRFFKTYTEKVWGMPCEQIKADWAAQRIRGLTLGVGHPGRFSRSSGRGIKTRHRTLTRQFHYPRKGPGMMWSRVSELVESKGGKVHLNAPVERVFWEPGGVTARAGGRPGAAPVPTSSARFRFATLIRSLDPAPPAEVQRCADDFSYRDFVIVALIVKGSDLFPDNWVYIHDPQVSVGRIQNYSNWSPEMTPDPSISSLGMEYFCAEGDALWNMTDKELIAFASGELEQIGLVGKPEILDATVIRVPKAYPVYNGTYRRGLAVVQEFLDDGAEFTAGGKKWAAPVQQSRSLDAGRAAGRAEYSRCEFQPVGSEYRSGFPGGGSLADR